METINKEVYFWLYCGTCKFKNCKDTDEPCNECLSNPMNENSHKPVKFKEDSNEKANDSRQ